MNPEYQRWVAKLLGYDFEIQYKPGSANLVADALSRKETGEIVLSTLLSTHGVCWDRLHQEIAADKDLQILIQGLASGQESGKFELVEGTLRLKGRLVIPSKSKVIPELLQEYHTSAVGGHAGEVKTYLRVAKDWYWKGMKGDITEFVKQCTICQQNKLSQQSPAGLLQPLPVPCLVWEDISMDFIEGLPMSQGYNVVLVVVDRFTKYAHFIGLRHPFDAFSVAMIFIKEVVRLHGFPGSIISDRDRIFMSTFWKELFKLQGSELKRSTSYHPQTDGQSEIVNKLLETYLRCFVGGKPRTWAKWLHWAEFSYNTATHLSSKISPFKALYGREAPHVLKVSRGLTVVDSLEEFLLERDAILDELHHNLLLAQAKMKKWADKHRREEAYEVGDLVYLKLQPYRQQSLARRMYEKLASRFYGPFKVIRKIGKVAYQLELPEDSRIHSVYHVSQLKRAVGQAPVSSQIPTQLTADLELLVEPEELLEVRQRQQGSMEKLEELIKWKNLPVYEATWEEAEKLRIQFPDFHLEDKVKLWGDGNVMTRAGGKKLVTFTRRNKSGQKGNSPDGGQGEKVKG